MMSSAPLRTCLLLPLVASFAIAPVAGCDLAEMPEDEVAADTDDDPDDDGETGDNGLEPGDDDDDDDGGSSGGEPPPSDDGAPFDDDPAQALGALAGMGYACYDAEDARYNLLFDADSVTVRFDDGTLSVGSYETTADSLTLDFPELGFAEAATDAAFALDALVYFETPTLQCGAFAFDYAAPDERDIVDCPTIKYIPETSWEENQFQFGNGGYVLRRRWTELPAVPDTLYAERNGVYRVVDDQVFIVLPFEDEDEQWLTGTITNEGVFIDQLEPEQGACE